VLPGGTGIHRQAVPQRNPETLKTKMRSLAAMQSSPGGFWKFSQKHEI